MTLRRLLILPICVSVTLLIYFSDSIVHSLDVIRMNVDIDAKFGLVILVAVILQLMGHIVRAYKMRYLLAPVKQGTTKFQFRALTIGYACNVLLPLKLGELVRAKVIASGEKISFGFALVTVAAERALDALILAIIGFALFILSLVGTKAGSYVVLLLVFTAVVASVLILAGRQNARLLRLWHHFTVVFDKPIRNSLRFKAWSIIYGIQRTFVIRRMVRYVMLTMLSWVLYIGSSLLLINTLLPTIDIGSKLIRAVAPYFGMSVPSGPASLGAFSQVTAAFASHVPLATNEIVVTNLLSWALLVVPVTIIGVTLLLLKTPEAVRRHLPDGHSMGAMTDKLSRTENITPEMGSFLESYFSGNSLSHIVHRLELKEDFRLLRYFKGGSDAITILALQDGKKVVKKIIPSDLAPRLQAQYEWLRRRHGKYGIVKVLGETMRTDHYNIDLEYDENNEMYFEYMHHSTIEESKKVLDTVWNQLFAGVYKSLEPVIDEGAVERYFEKHVYSCMSQACSVRPELLAAASPKTIRINGINYHNFHTIMKKIRANKRAMRDLATYSRAQEVHGDVAIDNILVSKSTHKPLLIDPAPDGNIIVGPVFDFGKNMQSLYCGYEFIVRSDDVVELQPDGSIEYYNRRSVPYLQLCDYVRDELSAKYLKDAERRAMIFHAGALLIRRLKHQVYQAPGLTLAIYGAGIKALNDFYDMYDNAK